MFEALLSHVRVDFRCRDVRVAEHNLDGSQVCVVLHEVSREGVPKRVGRDLFAYPRIFRQALDNFPEGLAGHGLAAAGYKKGFAPPLSQQNGTDRFQIVHDGS